MSHRGTELRGPARDVAEVIAGTDAQPVARVHGEVEDLLRRLGGFRQRPDFLDRDAKMVLEGKYVEVKTATKYVAMKAAARKAGSGPGDEAFGLAPAAGPGDASSGRGGGA